MSSDFMPVSAANELLKSLRDHVSGPISQEMVDAWALGAVELEGFLQGKILGSIRWVKELGVPDSPRLLEGFIVQHEAFDPEIDLPGAGSAAAADGAVAKHKPWKPSDVPATWDGPDDDTYHHVGFLCNRGKLEDRITVTLAPQIAWHGGLPSSGPRRVVPLEEVVPADLGSPVLLTFEVSIIPVIEQRA